jgi:hypothetical protein
MERAPYELYLSLMLIRNYSDEQIDEELRLLDYLLPDPELVDFLREDTPVVRRRLFRATKELQKWADDRFLDRALLNVNSKRVLSARKICFHSRIRHALELCLLRPDMPWETIVDQLDEIGNVIGLTEQMVQDYHQLFWSFDHMSLPAKRAYLESAGATEGAMTAMGGHPRVGVALDLGIHVGLSDVERLSFMRDVAFTRFARDASIGVLAAKEAKDWSYIVKDMMSEIRRVQPPTEKTTVELDAGVIDHIPHIDYLQQEDDESSEDHNANADLIPFRQR